MSQKPQFFHNQLIFSAILLTAFALRFLNLGNSPLNEIEAKNALAALALAQGESVALSGQASYTLLTGLIWRFFASNAWLARFWPALSGTLLLLIPYRFCEQLGVKNALLLSAALALSPVFVALSRFASSMSIGLTCLAFAFLAWRDGKSYWLGILLALALLSGSSIYLSLFIIAVLFILLRLFAPRNELSTTLGGLWNKWNARIEFKQIALSFALALAIGATFFFNVPQSIAGIGAGLIAFLRGWRDPQQIDGAKLALALIGNSWPLLIVAVIASIRAWLAGDLFGRLMSLWALLAILLVLLYPARKAEDLLWAITPMWLIVAGEFDRYLKIPEESRSAIAGTIFLFTLLAVFLYLQFAMLANGDPGSDLYRQQLIVSGVVIVLGLLAYILISAGWSRQIASTALLLSLGIIALTWMLSQSARILRHTPTAANELWAGAIAGGQSSLLKETLLDLSELNYGRDYELDIAVVSDHPTIAWELRNWPNAYFSAALGASAQPDIILTDGLEDQPNQSVAYRGQDFLWSTKIHWENSWPPNFFSWLLFRDAPLEESRIALWAREDLFPETVVEELQSDLGSGELFGSGSE